MRATSVLDGHVIPAPASVEVRDALTGFLIVAILPAVFWTAMIGGTASILGYAPNSATLGVVAVSIATFLGMVFSALRGRAV